MDTTRREFTYNTEAKAKPVVIDVTGSSDEVTTAALSKWI